MADEWLHQAENRVRAGGFETSVIELGDAAAQPVLLLHDGAWGGSSRVSWGTFLPRLADRYRVIVPDMLGFGDADKAVFVDRTQHDFRIDHLAAVLAALGEDRPVHIIGNSFGGAIALRSLARPGSIATKSIVSIAGSGGPWRTSSAPQALGSWDGTRDDLARIVALLISSDFEGFEHQLDARYASAIKPGHYRSVIAPSAPLPPGLRRTFDDPWPDQIAGSRIPTLLVRGLKDVLLEPEWADHLHSALPASIIVEINAQHAPQIDAPDELLAELDDFLGSVE